MKVTTIVVSFRSLHWMRVAIGSYRKFFPEERLLVVDNNPLPGEETWDSDCETERAWLASHPAVDFVDRRTAEGAWARRSHGAGMDVALSWCRQRGAEVMVHVEPDCLVTGRQWRANLLDAVARGAWMAASERKSYGALHPAPSAWRVDQAWVSFNGQSIVRDMRHPRFRKLVDLRILRAELRRQGAPRGWLGYWDTAQRAWFQAAVRDRAAQVAAPGFKHYWQGSTQKRLPVPALAAQFPEIASYIQRPLPGLRPRRVDSCPYRQDRHRRRRDVADCGLLRQLGGVQSAADLQVKREACQACCRSFQPSPTRFNTVVASLLYDLTSTVLRRGGVPGCSVARARNLRSWAKQNLDWNADKNLTADLPIPGVD
ncbi:MAG TPA: hypothetical protein VKI17_10965 [Gemmataceae bacterium]|nr:hypothetical protein [Gemmataceae bacterium]